MTLILALSFLLLAQAPPKPPASPVPGRARHFAPYLIRPVVMSTSSITFKAAGGSDPGKFVIDANKILNRAEEFMGTLQCVFTMQENELYCDTVGDWRFTVKGNTITGTLTLKNGTLYRRINVTKH